MRLQEARRKSLLQAKEVVAQAREIAPRFDEALLSKMEHGLCLPTPPLLMLFCLLYKAKISDLYELEEIDLAGVQKQIAARKRTGDNPSGSAAPAKRKMQFTLNAWACDLIDSGLIQQAGYRSQTEFFYDCLRRLQRETDGGKKYAANQEMQKPYT